MAEKVDVLVKFVTKQAQYAVPGASVSVPSSADNEKLNTILKTYIAKGTPSLEGKLPSFEFLVKGQVLRTALDKQIEESGLSVENVVEVEYFEQLPPPTPKDSLEHDDWVSAIHCGEKWLLTGCYDNTLHLWDVDLLGKGDTTKAHKLTIPAHNAPVKAVAWLDSDSTTKRFISASIDQTALIWTWNSETNSVECIRKCSGHTQSVECLAVDPSKTVIATGSWDTMLKLWPSVDKNEAAKEEENQAKKKKGNKVQKMTPIVTLSGHSESIGGVVWTNKNELATASWDHTIRLWDTDIGGIKSQMVGNCAFFSISWSPLNQTLITGCADNVIRLYDPRASDGTICQKTYISHRNWIPSVKWSTTNEYQFASAGFDTVLKQWDSRSPKAPLYDLVGHDKKLLTVDWSNPNYLVSGSEDCTVKVFSSGSRGKTTKESA